MDSEDNLFFSPKTIGYALAISVALCLALPCIAVLTYTLLMLLSLVINLIGAIVMYVVYGPFILIYKLLEVIWNCSIGQLDCCSFIVLLPVIGFGIGLIIGFFLGIFEWIRDLISDHPNFRGFVIFLVSFWLFCLVLSFIFNSIGFYDEGNDYGMILRSYASSSWNSIIGVFFKYKVYIFSWAPVILAALPTIIIYGAIFLYQFSKIFFAGIFIILRAILLGIMIIVDWLFRKRRIRHICPNEDCSYIGASSVYICPHCGELLINLKPSMNGIFYKKCPSCGKDVSATCLTGRDKYATACPKCNNTWEYFNVGNIRSSVFIVEGAARSGKTSLLVQMLIQWRSHFFKHIHFLINDQKNTVNQLGNRIHEHGFCPPTTRLLHPEAYVMHCNKSFHSFMAYFYDTGGRNVSRSLQAGVAEPYYNLANGIFLVIDPWAERCVIDAFGGKKPPRTYYYSKQNANEVIGKLCCKLDHIYTKSFNAGFNIPICVVVTKCDIYRLNESIGGAAKCLQSSNEWNKQSKRVEDFLVNLGMYNFVSVIKTRFKKYAFFAVSALDDSTYNQDTVLNPLLWMMYQVNNFK